MYAYEVGQLALPGFLERKTDREDAQVRCIRCGALVPDVEGPTHRYIAASPGCWAVFGEVVAREFSDYRYGRVHLLKVRDQDSGISPPRRSGRGTQGLIPQSLIPRFPNSPHIERVEAWAVWNAWGPHHETARRWAGL